jgi:vacuolar-type H+-ATPase subunit H
MNIHEAVDRLEYLIAHSRQIPLTRTVVVDQEEVLACIDELRLSLPDEIKQARWTLQEQQRLLSEAQAEAARTITKASERAQTMMGQQELSKRAEKQAEAILREASARADEVKKAADRYAWDVMQSLEAQLLRTVATVKKGVEALRIQPVKEVELSSQRNRSGGATL